MGVVGVGRGMGRDGLLPNERERERENQKQRRIDGEESL